MHEEIEEVLTEKLTGLLKKINLKSLAKEVKRLNILGYKAEMKFKCIVSRADEELLNELEKREAKTWKVITEIANEMKEEQVRVSEVIGIIEKMRLPTTSPLDHAKGIVNTIGERYPTEVKMKLIAHTTWPGDYQARAKLHQISDLETMLYTIETLTLEKEKKRKAGRNNKTNKTSQ